MATEQQQALADLQAKVAEDVTVEKSAVTLITGLKASLDAAIAASATDDGAALQALSAQLGSSTNDLAAAVAANTPAASA